MSAPAPLPPAQDSAQEPAILTAIACNLDADLLSAAFPLLEEGRVGALEWSFDALYQTSGPLPDWFTALLQAYASRQRLVGHGVYFSLLSGRWTAEQQQWLRHLQALTREFAFDHITEHFGFFTGQNFHAGAPLPVPYTRTALRLGQDRLRRLQEACGCPVGLENLAFAYTPEEVRRHGEFLARLVEPVNGFLILDLHNLFCQLHNFSVPYEELLALYPLERVREIHISGGSWEASGQEPGRQVRRDTHDEAVPEEVFALLAQALPRCPNLKYVVLEQLGSALQTEPRRARFQADFRRMEAVVSGYQRAGAGPAHGLFLPPPPGAAGPAAEDELLHEQQQQLTRILETAPSCADARRQLHASALAHTGWKIEEWEPRMLETALRIAQKWK